MAAAFFFGWFTSRSNVNCRNCPSTCASMEILKFRILERWFVAIWSDSRRQWGNIKLFCSCYFLFSWMPSRSRGRLHLRNNYGGLGTFFPVGILEFKSRKCDLLHLSQCSVGKLKGRVTRCNFFETCIYTFERCELGESFRNCIYT